MSVLLRKATLKDVTLISIMAERIWRVHYTPIIGEEQVNFMLKRGYSEEALTKSMQDGEIFFLCNDGESIYGYVSMTKKAEGEYFLNKFYLEIKDQGKGYGKKIFELLLAEFPDLKLIRLQVNRLNYRTINFYFRVGFTIEYAKDFDIGGGYSMDDYVMLWKRS